ncbi:MAG: hypothetical protein COA61_001915 [Zetaproteobacteria bacterium]|nr:hypothetical protein [Zetaproteobacteria bacterium]
MTDLEMEQIRSNINKMVADVDFSHKNYKLDEEKHKLDEKKYMLDAIKLVLYGVAVGAAVVLATVKILG